MRLFNKKFKTVLVGGSLILMPMACSSEEDEESTTSTAATSTADADEISDLNISSALKLTIPSLTSDDSAALALGGGASLAGKKSFEACELENLVNEGVSRVSGISGLFCHLELENEQLKFGVKYKLEFASDEGSQEAGLNIWVDNSAAADGTLTVYTCEQDVLREKIQITGLGTDAAKGTIINAGSEEYEGSLQSWAEDIVFDLNHSVAGISFLNVKSAFSSDDHGTYKQHINLEIREEGVSNLRVSRSGTWGDQTFSQMGAAKHNGTYGEVLFADASTGTYTDGDGNSQSYGDAWIHRAFFDESGYVVAQTASDAFADPDGELHVADADVPKKLGSDFSAGTFASTDWDCATDETLTIDMTGDAGASHDACDGDRWEWKDCYSGYEQSQEDHVIDEDAQLEGEEFEKVEE